MSPAFMNDEIIMGLVYEHMRKEATVVQRFDAKATLLAFSK